MFPKALISSFLFSPTSLFPPTHELGLECPLNKQRKLLPTQPLLLLSFLLSFTHSLLKIGFSWHSNRLGAPLPDFGPRIPREGLSRSTVTGGSPVLMATPVLI